MTPLPPTSPAVTSQVGTDSPADLPTSPGSGAGELTGSFHQTLLQTLGDPVSSPQDAAPPSPQGSSADPDGPDDAALAGAGEGALGGDPVSAGPVSASINAAGNDHNETSGKASPVKTTSTIALAADGGAGTTGAPDTGTATVSMVSMAGLASGTLIAGAPGSPSRPWRDTGGGAGPSGGTIGASSAGVASDRGAGVRAGGTARVGADLASGSGASGSVASKVLQRAPSAAATLRTTGGADDRAQAHGNNQAANGGGAQGAAAQPATGQGADGQLADVRTGAPPAVAAGTSAPGAVPPEDRPAPDPPIPGVASQLVSVLSPLRVGSDGTRSLTVALHPSDLGDVRVTVTATDQNVVVRMSAASDAGRDALRQNLPQLQQQLSGHGQRATVVLADAGGGDAQARSGSTHVPGASTFSDGAGDPELSGADVVARASGPPGSGSPTATRLLDLRL